MVVFIVGPDDRPRDQIRLLSSISRVLSAPKTVDEIEKAFPSGDDELHLSLGFGFVFDRFQVDAAADFSDPIDTYSLLVAVFF